MMRRKDDKADMLVQLYLSFFSLWRAVTLAKRLKNRIVKTVIERPGYTGIYRFLRSMTDIWDNLMARYIPGLTSIPLCQGMEWLPTWKAIPSKGLAGRRDEGLFATFQCELSWAIAPYKILGNPYSFVEFFPT